MHTPHFFNFFFVVVIYQLFEGRAIFRADSEPAELEVISRVCGTPTPKIWPGLVKLPVYETLSFKKLYPRQVKEFFAK
jgi:cyclin-dependent kinase 12/13